MLRSTTFVAALAVLAGATHVSADTVMPTPTHHYPFDADASDVTGTNDGTLTNGAGIVADAERGSVLELDGVDDFVKLQRSNVPGGATDVPIFSIAGWVNLPAGNIPGTKVGGIYVECNSTYGNSRHFLAPVTGGIQFDQYHPSGGTIRSTVAINDDTWHHVVYVQNEPGGYRRQLYIDGELNAFDNSPERYTGTTPNWYTIGARFGRTWGTPFANYTEGRIDDLRFYNVALNADQVGVLAVPEPSCVVLLGITGGVGLALAWRRRVRG